MSTSLDSRSSHELILDAKVIAKIDGRSLALKCAGCVNHINSTIVIMKLSTHSSPFSYSLVNKLYNTIAKYRKFDII